MPRSTIRTGRIMTVATLLSSPLLGILVVLVWVGELRPGAALVAIAAGVVFSAAFAYRLISDVAMLRRYAETMADDAQSQAAPAGFLGDLTQAVVHARHAWSRERRDLLARAHSGETVFDSLPDPVLLVDENRRVLRATEAARDLLGAQAVGRDLASSVRAPAVFEAVDAAIEGDSAIQEVEFKILEPVERTFAARIVRLPQAAADGTIAVVSLYELTETRRSEQTRVDFVANASHELRTPLSVLVGCIKTLRGAARDDAEAQARFLAMMEAQADRMQRLVEDLLSLSRIELDEHRAPDTPVAIGRMIGQVADSMTFPARARGVEIVLDGIDTLPDVPGDELQLNQLFQNLIDNAIKYGRPDGQVTLHGRRVEQGRRPTGLPADAPVVAVTVEDQGDGIPPEHLPRLTERFYRIDTARSREMGGTGLGLAIVKHIVYRHRGYLAIESDEGVGSRFTVYLPALREAAPTADAPTPAAAAG